MIVAGENVIKGLPRPRPPTTASNPPVLAERAVASTAPILQTPDPTGSEHEQQIRPAGFDQPFHQAIARMSGGLSPLALQPSASGFSADPGVVAKCVDRGAGRLQAP